MVHAIRIHQNGGPEVMKWESVEVPAPGPGQVRLKQHAVGVNYIDIYQRSGLYKMPMPFVPGSEGAGEVVAVGAGVTDFKVGDRGAYAGALGGYAEERVMPADRLVKLPDSIDYKTGAAMMLQGMTVRYLLRQTYKVGPGTTMLLHAAAGGIGLIASPVGAAPRRDHHRHRQHRRQGGARQGARLHPRHQLQDGRLREAHEGADERPGRRRRLRCRRQGYLSRLARLPEAARPVGELRQRLGRHHQLRLLILSGQGLALRHAADARHLRRQARRSARQRQRAVRRGLARVSSRSTSTTPIP